MKSARLRLTGKGHCLGQTARFVELDVDVAVAADETRKIGPCVTTFIGAEWHRTSEICEGLVFVCLEGLLDQDNTEPRKLGGQRGEIGLRPAFIGVPDQTRSG